VSAADRSGWPPIVSGAKLPWWAFARDLALTLLMWGGLGYIIVTNLDVGWQVLQLLLGNDAALTDPFLEQFLGRMERRVAIIGGLLFVLAATTLVSILRHRRRIGLPQPPPVPDGDLARDLGLGETALGAMRQQATITVDLDENGRLTAIAARPGLGSPQLPS
jgi:poly-beta-1,6-N-acetyl-D-glucosamine biosynthesis protein PgaD